MPQKKQKAINVSNLRQRAEDVLEASSGDNADPAKFSPADMKTLIHDLQVHQIELEMQNDELKQSQEELADERTRYFDFFNMAPVGFFSIDEQKLILECNSTAMTLLGTHRNALIKKPFTRFILKEDQDIYYLHSNQVFETKMPQECNLRMLKNDGFPLWVHLATTTVLNVEGAIMTRIVMSDITEHKQTEDALIEARDSAQRANLAKSIFLSSMSHELRTPLNSILGFGQILETDKTLNPTQANYVQKILSGGRLLLTLVSEVLDLALIESGKTVLLLESVDCSEVMNECLDLVQSLAEDSGICLNCRSFDPLMRVLADRNRLKQILINLLSNAVKYNSREGTVRIVAVMHEKGVRIMVTDTGPGIPSDKLGELFIPFNRLGKEAGTIPGTGLGLALSKRLAKQMKGDIGLESTGDQGSCFWVELPLIERYDSLSKQKNDDHQSTPVGKRITKIKALIVDDVEMNRELLGEFLSLFNLNGFMAASGEEALEAVSKQEFDIIFMDVRMPGMDGIETTRRIREMSLQHIPIIAVTALAMKGDQDKFLKLGMDDYISKPIKIEKVQNILEKYTCYLQHKNTKLKREK